MNKFRPYLPNPICFVCAYVLFLFTMCVLLAFENKTNTSLRIHATGIPFGRGGVKTDIFQNGKTECLGHTPQQHFKAIWKHVDFGGRPRASLGAPRVIQGNHDSEKYNFSGVGFCGDFNWAWGIGQGPPGRCQNRYFPKWQNNVPETYTAATF